jgi:hypothetical protein
MMPRVRLSRRLAIATTWLLATWLAPAEARAEPAAPREATVCSSGQVEPVRFRLGTSAGPLGPSSAIADFNSDGRPDVAFADAPRFPGANRFRLQVEVSGRQPVSLDFESSEPALAISVADVDHDDDLDIVLSRPLSGETIGVWLNDGTGRFTSAPINRFSRRAPPLRQISSLVADTSLPLPGLAPQTFKVALPAAAVGVIQARSSRSISTPSRVFRAPLTVAASRPRSPPAPFSLFS